MEASFIEKEDACGGACAVAIPGDSGTTIKGEKGRLSNAGMNKAASGAGRRRMGNCLQAVAAIKIVMDGKRLSSRLMRLS